MALRNAVESDSRVLAARSIFQSRMVEAEGAWSAYLPVLRGVSSVGNSQNRDPLIRDGDKRTYGLELEQPIPLFGRESARVELARVAVRVEESEVRRVEQAVVGEVLEAMLGIATAREALALRERLAANLRLQVGAVRATVAGGGMKATEERLILSRAAQSAALHARAEADLAAAEARLRRLLPDATPASLNEHDMRRWWSGPLSREALEASALQVAPVLLKAQAEAEQASAEYAVARADLWPKVSISVQKTMGTFGTASAEAHSIFLGVSVPLFEGGATISRVDSAAHRQTAARERATQEGRMTIQRIAETWARWRAAEAMSLAWRESELQEEEAIMLVEQQVTGGGATEVGLLRARQAWLEIVVQGVDYRSQRDVAWVRLMQEAGALELTPVSPDGHDFDRHNK
ncbi:TolC family protein [Propionivibrio sp.]|uniref:TolC family protein n=1 Tax=Propionivibrio sp. TaxID=2212460 RepID=UPI003BF270B9